MLTETLQVRAAIALEAITRHGICIDTGQVQSTQQRLRDRLAELADDVTSQSRYAGLFKTNRQGQVILSAKSGKPSINRSRLIALLEAIADEHEIIVPRTAKTKLPSTSVKFWSQHQIVDPFLATWVELENVAKLCQFFSNLHARTIHPRYTVLVRTGRTSCQNPNIQQLPRAGGFREMVVASPGNYLLTIDYSAIELRTLAAICEQRYGRSQLAQVLRDGVDPHAFTAAMFEGISLAKFAELKQDQPDRVKRLRQQAKALNFGIPGGLGAASLVAYAKASYGVELTLEQAQRFRQRLIAEVYPELSRYLNEDAIGILAQNLQASPIGVRCCFETEGILGAAKRIIRGNPNRRDGQAYESSFVDRIWHSLSALNHNSELRAAIDARKGGEWLYQRLLWSPVMTPTGRLRGRVSFSQGRNTPFQGIAADGAKIALWNLLRSGYRCVAFVHDEMLIELPIDSDHTAAAQDIDRILRESMQLVTGTVPVACEYSLTDRWYKGSEAVFDQGKLTLWRPDLTVVRATTLDATHKSGSLSTTTGELNRYACLSEEEGTQ